MSETPVDHGRGLPIGKFRVSFEVLSRPYGKPEPAEYIQPIGLVGPALVEREGVGKVIVEDQPSVSNKKPYEGPLTQHELSWLMSLPGVEYNLGFRFSVVPLDKEAEDALAALLA
jgi:hypothetical protein